ncbi:LysR family transcriptional regulator [Mycobacterium sp.]|uniref:LysR family transcriptional regulator n=1 Tax=Mycobacterium sp. TaxID=1785 RepID=UPI002D4007C2|nr:LysR substrate-binding domain-containing protein [Mycobacterium sp.]HZA12128.1 LysR substrate-binding domain-containing protein [Mycobacterium sp.]
MDLDLRKLRYFVAVAEELNFRRAAERLHLAQPVLSRQIRALEKELHAQLFTRDSTGTQLTEAGSHLLTDATALLAHAEAARRRVAQAAQGIITFTVGFMPGLTITEPVRALGAAHPDISVEVLRTDWTNQISVLHDGRADIGYVRMPVDLTGLQSSPLLTEPRVAVLPTSHRLAGKEKVSLDDLADEHLLQHPEAVPEWQAVATELRDGPRAAFVDARSVEEKLERVAAGRGFSVLPESTATYYQRPDVAWMPITDIPPNEVRLAWVSTRRNPLIAEFVQLAESAMTQAGG